MGFTKFTLDGEFKRPELELIASESRNAAKSSYDDKPLISRRQNLTIQPFLFHSQEVEYIDGGIP
jgi:hypothetical protein